MRSKEWRTIEFFKAYGLYGAHLRVIIYQIIEFTYTSTSGPGIVSHVDFIGVKDVMYTLQRLLSSSQKSSERFLTHFRPLNTLIDGYCLFLQAISGPYTTARWSYQLSLSDLKDNYLSQNKTCYPFKTDQFSLTFYIPLKEGFTSDNISDLQDLGRVGERTWRCRRSLTHLSRVNLKSSYDHPRTSQQELILAGTNRGSWMLECCVSIKFLAC